MLNLLGMLTSGSTQKIRLQDRKVKFTGGIYRLYLEGQIRTAPELAAKLGISRQAAHAWLVKHENLEVKVVDTISVGRGRPVARWTWIANT